MPCKCAPSICPGIELESVVWRSKEKIENLSSSLTAKHVISRRRKDQNGCKMKNKHAKRAKLLYFIVKYMSMYDVLVA